jgi:magnesium chelatase family protein
VPALAVADMALPAPREGSAEVATRVAAARSLQADRFAALGRPGLRTNGEAEGELLDRIAICDEPAHGLLRRAAHQLALSARGYHRVLRVARTIADLDGSETIRKPHIAEAVAFRRIRRTGS